MRTERNKDLHLSFGDACLCLWASTIAEISGLDGKPVILSCFYHFILKSGKKNLPRGPGSEVIKLFSCSAQLRLKFILLINVKMPTIVGILTFISRINY